MSRASSAGRRLSGRKSTTEEAAQPQRAVPPPVPVDMCVPPGTRALIITGPNTGGKTATIKVGSRQWAATVAMQHLYM